MSYVKYNQNPCDKWTIDCTVRALATLLDADWYDIYDQLYIVGRYMCDMPSSKAVINEYLRAKGFEKFVIPNTCPFCYSVQQFAEDHPNGRYLLATDSHVVPVISGDWIDTWNSASEVPLFYWTQTQEDY